ncbi:unnamed protein product [Peronospora effusa]|nr:unnamed protein product [Peronospora effusa]
MLSSYIRRKRGMPSVPTKAAPEAALPGAALPDMAPLEITSTFSQDPDHLDSHDLDVNMADSTLELGNTMLMDDLVEGTVTPPPCAASVPIPAELAKALKTSSRSPQEIYLT